MDEKQNVISNLTPDHNSVFQVIRSYNRILDLGEDCVDLDVLMILTTAVVNDLSKSTECPTAKLRKLTLTLCGRLTSKVKLEQIKINK